METGWLESRASEDRQVAMTIRLESKKIDRLTREQVVDALLVIEPVIKTGCRETPVLGDGMASQFAVKKMLTRESGSKTGLA